MFDLLKSIALVIGTLTMIAACFLIISIAFFWVLEKFNKKRKPEKKDNVHQMYCDHDGIKWGDIIP